MSTKVAVVFTAKSIERILNEGGTAAWRLDRNHARQCVYAVCTRNANASWVEGKEDHHSAFLMGRISDVVPCPPTPENHEAPDNRYLIEFSEFARVNIPNAWRGDRNPVKYMTLEQLGINISDLKWEPMPLPVAAPDTPHEAAAVNRTRPLTMAEAKKGLSLTFNVPVEAIEITIRG